jgi:hypothetical protein
MFAYEDRQQGPYILFGHKFRRLRKELHIRALFVLSRNPLDHKCDVNGAMPAANDKGDYQLRSMGSKTTAVGPPRVVT